MNYVPIVAAVESKGWDLYDTSSSSLEAGPWPGSRQSQYPVDSLEVDGTYLLVPQSETERDLKRVYSRIQEAPPCLQVDAYNNPDYDVLSRNFSPNFVVFTRLAVRHAAEGPVLILFTPESTQQPRVDVAIVQARKAQAVLARDLGAIRRADLQRSAVWADRLAPRR